MFNLVFHFAPMICRHCSGSCIKKGLIKGRQRYQCRKCSKYQQKKYRLKRFTEIGLLIQLSNEGMSISSIARILHVSKATVTRKLKCISSHLSLLQPKEQQQEYELDELYTYVGNKDNECWIMYAINRSTRKVIECVVGKRTTDNIKRVVEKVLTLKPKKIYTDFLNIYPALIPASLHKASRYRTNRIERLNLTLRTHLKRLSRKTICFSRSLQMLEACLKIYFWSQARQTNPTSPD